MLLTCWDIVKACAQRLASVDERKLAALDDLKKSLLHQAFSDNLWQWTIDNGQLTTSRSRKTQKMGFA
ncbi:MAG: hypothetical protein WKF77_03095 [Planctomycetaceae bacterium]